MSIASELNNLEGNIEDSYDAVNDMGGIIPAQRNMDNLDQAIRTIPQNQGTTYTAGNGIDITSDVISVDNTTVPFFTDLATVATTGDYGDLLNTPTIPAAQVNSDWNANSGVAQILNKPSLATVATSGLYSDLTGTPSLATVATSGDYDDLLNKPTIPTVNDATLTIQHNGTTVQTFTANQSTSATANIETIWADDIEATTPIPAVETAMIADGAVTSAKIADATITGAKLDFASAPGTGIVKTYSDQSGSRVGIYFADGTLITHRRVSGVIAVTTAIGSLYHATVPSGDYWGLAPVNAGAEDFISRPDVTITPYGTSTQYFWIGAYSASEPVKNSSTGNKWALPEACVDILRATTNNNVNYAFHIMAIGRWK